MTACEKCGQEHLDFKGRPGCTKHVLDRDADGRKIPGTDRPCRKPRNAGLDCCGTHGGSTKAARAISQRARTDREAKRLMARFGGAIDTTPTEALLDSVKWTAGYVRFLREQVERVTNNAGEVDDLVWGKTREKIGGEDQGTTYEAGAHAWDALLRDWTQTLAKLCAEAIRAGIEERRVRLAEQQGALVADVIRAILGDLALTPEQAAKVPEVVPRHLRLLTGGAA